MTGSNPPGDQLDEIVVEFVNESSEQLTTIEADLLQIEEVGIADGELVNNVFRVIHSIKGAAGFLNFTTLADLAHHLENVLNLIRNEDLIADSERVDVMLRAADKIRLLLEDVAGSNDVDVSDHVRELQVIAAASASPDEAEAADRDASADRTPSTDVTASPEAQPEPTSEGTADGSELTTAGTPAGAAADAPADATSANPAPADSTPPKPAAETARTTPSDAGNSKAGTDSASTDAAAGNRAAATPDASIRVNVSMLDELMNLAGELVLGRNQLLRNITTWDRRGIELVSSRIDQVTSELQEAVMQTRMQPIGNVFSKFPRVVRDLARSLGKQATLTITGNEVELDRTIIEAINAPLTHLIRNAMDHGVEAADVRKERGKDPTGSIHLSAYHQNGKVNIEIRDDGGGIDADKLRAKALDRGLMTREEVNNLGQREALQLIFLPGMSTAEKVTSVSGRGVGMDVVQTNLERLGGTVELDTQLGQGTTINIKLPLTLAILTALLVEVGDQRYAVPQANISELIRIRQREYAERTHQVDGRQLLKLRGELLPLIRLSQALRLERRGTQPPEAPTGNRNVLVVETGLIRYGILVDSLIDSEEIVVKPLGHGMQSCQDLAGATILGDGRVALILDVAGLAATERLQNTEQPTLEDLPSINGDEDTESASLVMFRNAEDELFAVPMTQVARIDRVRASELSAVGNREILHQGGAAIPILRLERLTSSKPAAPQDRYHILIFRFHRHELGLLVPAIVDMRDLRVAVTDSLLRENGIAGSFVHEGRSIRLLDVFEIALRAFPEWFESNNGSAGAPATRRVLLAEDSKFFRNQLSRHVESGGFEVIACEDGAAAWETLLSDEEGFDLLLTDVEMPNVDGLELTRRVKAHPELRRLPVIALTSLAGDADVAAGRQAGVDDYQIKLDRSALLDSIKHLTQGGRVLAESSPQDSAEDSARRADSTSASTACEYVSFHLNDLLLGVDIDHIQEIHRHLEVTPIPGVPDHVRGVMNLRGEVVTILDPKRLLRGENTRIDEGSSGVIVRHGQEKIALLVDGIGDVISTHTDRLEPIPPNMRGVDSRYFSGVLQLGKQLLIAVDLDELVAEVSATSIRCEPRDA